jgi:hypothetical protein
MFRLNLLLIMQILWYDTAIWFAKLMDECQMR